MQGAVANLVRPDSTSAFIFAFAPTAALQLETSQYADALRAFVQSRLDKQIGTTAPGATATTDVVAKPGASGLLSLASESGAFAQTVNGTTVTLNGNPWNAIQLAKTGSLYGMNPLCASNCVNPLRTTNVSVAFTVDQSAAASVPSAGGATTTTQNVGTVLVPTSQAKFSALTVQTNVWHSQDPAAGGFQHAWSKAYSDQQTALKEAGDSLLGAYQAMLSKMQKTDTDGTFKKLQEGIEEQLARDVMNRDWAQMTVDYENYLEQYVAVCRSKDPDGFNALVTSSAAQLAQYVQLNQAVIDTARGKPMLTLEYVYSQPVSQPSTHDVRVVLGQQWAKTGAQVTFNGAASFYGSRPATATYGRVKDVQVSGEFDVALGNKTAPVAVLSAAGYGQYQYDPSVLNITPANLAPGTNITLPANAQQFLGSAGWLGVAQGKVTLQLPKSLSIPVAIKWSNKTDLLDTPDTRGQIGLSYDFSALTTLLKGQ